MAGPAYYVDARKGHDREGDGSKEKPWRSADKAIRRLAPGDTLFLRQGVYYEHLDVVVSGALGRPITIRSYPGEMAVVDGGLPEFNRSPKTSWQPAADGASHEYVSSRRYPQFGKRPLPASFPAAAWEPFHGKEEQRPMVLGHFADSMVPLHGYRSPIDMRDSSMVWDVKDKHDDQNGVYCGPGLWFNRRTERIHVRLAPTDLSALKGRNYRGPTDPRTLPLVISDCGTDEVLRINGTRHILIQDLVFRGAAGRPLASIHGAENIVLDGVTIYGGAPSLLINASQRLKLLHCAVRSLSAPWSSRASMKYRGTPSYSLITRRGKPLNKDLEIAYCDFTDGHDGLWLRYVNNLRFHHNYVDNFNDDGLEVGAKKRDHELYIYQNAISRCLLTFTLHQIEVDESPRQTPSESGVFITRNLIDLRAGIFKTPPSQADPTGSFLAKGGTLCGDHGSPLWPNYYFYHNTVIRADPSWRGYYGFGMGGRGLQFARRRVFNNIFLQQTGVPGLNFSASDADVGVDGNLHWGLADGPGQGDTFLKRRGSYAFRRKDRPRSWMRLDLFVDPQLLAVPARGSQGPLDVALKKASPAIDAGAKLPGGWFDPLADRDSGQPDIGALPFGVAKWQVGVAARRKASQ